MHREEYSKVPSLLSDSDALVGHAQSGNSSWPVETVSQNWTLQTYWISIERKMKYNDLQHGVFRLGIQHRHSSSALDSTTRQPGSGDIKLANTTGLTFTGSDRGDIRNSANGPRG